MNIKDIKKEALEFQREILLINENTSKFGKINAFKVLNFREEKINEKIKIIEKICHKKNTLQGKLIII